MKISLVLCVWNTSHLLKRSLETYVKQDFPKDDWEVILIDDNSLDDVYSVVKPYIESGVINISYHRLEHPYGMRGNTVALNTGFDLAIGDVIAETTPEILLQPQTIRTLYEPHVTNPRCFVAIKTYNLMYDTQVLIDTVDWRSDIMNISKLPEWDNIMTQLQRDNINFRTHQLCSIRKDVFFEITNHRGFPLFGDWGTEDPWYSNLRETVVPEVENITITDFMAIHQWHLPFQYWQSKGLAPYLNNERHSMTNYMNDKSGHVPEGGTCEIWDKGSHAVFGEEERKDWCKYDQKLINSGFPESILRTL